MSVALDSVCAGSGGAVSSGAWVCFNISRKQQEPVDGQKGRPVPMPPTQQAEVRAFPVGTDEYGCAGATHPEVTWCE